MPPSNAAPSRLGTGVSGGSTLPVTTSLIQLLKWLMSVYMTGRSSPPEPLTRPAITQRSPSRTSPGPPESMLVAAILPSSAPMHSSRSAWMPSQAAAGWITVSASRSFFG